MAPAAGSHHTTLSTNTDIRTTLGESVLYAGPQCSPFTRPNPKPGTHRTLNLTLIPQLQATPLHKQPPSINNHLKIFDPTPTYKPPPSTSNPTAFGQAEKLSPMVPNFTHFRKARYFPVKKKSRSWDSNPGDAGRGQVL